LITSLNNKTADSIGTLDIKGTENQSLVDISTANSKYWNVV
jgi:hypothetical protein